jgi:glycolate oxidase
MQLAPEIYRAFEDVLGPENISADPAVTECYAFQPIGGIRQGKRFFLSPAAVILPGDTQDVQAIMKLCGRFKLKVKAFCTGYGVYNVINSEDTVLLDLRRMNRLIDIDEKNMIAIVEPYVSIIQVMIAAWKKGLACNTIGAGSQASLLASCTSMHGNGTLAISQGYSGRNLLGVEWVLPTGEIIKLGAPGSGAGWFSGDGPGPSLRGIMRGALGAMSGLGVFTKCAVHLHPWYGPAELEVKGVSPYYEAVIPPNMEYHICEFKNWQQFADATYKVGATGIAYTLNKAGWAATIGNLVTGNNNEFYEKRIKGDLAIPWYAFSLIIAAATPDEHAWQVKTLDKIMEETGGKFAEIENNPLFKGRDSLNLFKHCFVPRHLFRSTGCLGVNGIVGVDSTDHMAIGLAAHEKLFKKWAPRDIMLNQGDPSDWGTTYEGGHLSIFENGGCPSSTNDYSIKEFNKFAQEGEEMASDTPFANNLFLMGDEMLKRYGPRCLDYPKWMKKIKNAFDPEMVADPLFYRGY